MGSSLKRLNFSWLSLHTLFEVLTLISSELFVIYCMSGYIDRWLRCQPLASFYMEDPGEAPEMPGAKLGGRGTKRMALFFLLTLGFPPYTSGISGATPRPSFFWQ